MRAAFGESAEERDSTDGGIAADSGGEHGRGTL